MKKQYLSALLFLTLVLTALSSVSAQQGVRLDTSVDNRAVQVETRTRANTDLRAVYEAQRIKRAEMDVKREAMRIEFETKRAETQAKRVEFQQAAAKRQVENVARVISATIERLEKIIVRLESRIAKVKARGGITSESEGFVAAARVNLSDARLAVDAFASIDLSSDQARENFQRIRAAAAEAREHVRAAHRNLMMAVRSLGSVEVNIEAAATSTSEQ